LVTVGWWGIEASRFTYTWGFTILFLAFGGVVLTAIARPNFGRHGVAAIVGRPLAWIGIYSYTIYLAHSVVLHYPGMASLRARCMAMFGGTGSLGGQWFDRLLFWCLSILGGILLSHLVERPALRMRQRWFSMQAPLGVTKPMPLAA
jgi:peptidoglycan/LPS O-acetylase OafA/YrhL